MPWLSTPRILPTDSGDVDTRHIGARPRQRAHKTGPRIRRTANDLQRLAVTGIHRQHLQPVGIGMLFGVDHLGDGERLVGRLVINIFDLKANRCQPLADLSERGIGFQMVLQPGQREFHVSRLAISCDSQPER